MSEHVTKKEATPPREEPTLQALVEVIEDANGITLYADLPGVPRENLDIHIDGETLTLVGTLGLAMPETMESAHAEVTLPRYRRVFSLSKELDSTKIQAEFQQGVLKLRIPKAEHAQTRKIQVQAA